MLRLIALLAAGAVLAWLIVVHSFAAYYARTSPELALSLNGGQPAALVNVANARLALLQSATSGAIGGAPADGEALTDGSSRLSGFAKSGAAAGSLENGAEDDIGSAADAGFRSALRGLALRTLAANPLESGALFLLGQIAAWEGDDERARRLMEASARRSFRETAAVYQLLLGSLETQDYADALDRADAIMRTAPEHTRHIASLVASVTEDETALSMIERRLAQRPPWRTVFLTTLPQAVTDARRPLEVLLALKSSAAPPTRAELRSYLTFLVGRKLYELAYYTWLQFLSPEDLKSTGLLYNGRFDRPLSGLPFDWVMRNGTGVTVQVSPAADLERGRSLLVELGHGRVEFGSVSQTILLPPGTYRFAGLLKGQLAGRRGLVWRVSCADNARRRLGASEMMTGLAPTWRTFGFTFEVPSEPPCRAQTLTLRLDARSTSERLVSGTVQYADLKIERL